MKKRRYLLWLIFVMFIIILCIVLFFSLKGDSKDKKNIKEKEVKTEEKEEKKLKIIDEDSNSRPYAVMINNIKTVWGYQSGLEDSYLIYEMMVEGGYTRLMALFKDKNLSRIGSVRSSRHYFLDYAKENDAIYVHFGWSPKAEVDMKKLGVDNINFMTYNGYTRDRTLGLPSEHTAFTSTEDILKGADAYGYSKNSEVKPVLNYSVDEIDLTKKEGVIPANNVIINFSNSHVTSFVYDTSNKTYKRYQNDTLHTDYISKNVYTAKNIIVYQLEYSLITGDDKGRQNLANITSGEGYYISNGYAVPITYEKNSRTEKTIYRYKNNEEIIVNDGNTYIEIAPKNRQITIN